MTTFENSGAHYPEQQSNFDDQLEALNRQFDDHVPTVEEFENLQAVAGQIQGFEVGEEGQSQIEYIGPNGAAINNPKKVEELKKLADPDYWMLDPKQRAEVKLTSRFIKGPDEKPKLTDLGGSESISLRSPSLPKPMTYEESVDFTISRGLDARAHLALSDELRKRYPEVYDAKLQDPEAQKFMARELARRNAANTGSNAASTGKAAGNAAASANAAPSTSSPNTSANSAPIPGANGDPNAAPDNGNATGAPQTPDNRQRPRGGNKTAANANGDPNAASGNPNTANQPPTPDNRQRPRGGNRGGKKFDYMDALTSGDYVKYKPNSPKHGPRVEKLALLSGKVAYGDYAALYDNIVARNRERYRNDPRYAYMYQSSAEKKAVADPQKEAARQLLGESLEEFRDYVKKRSAENWKDPEAEGRGKRYLELFRKAAGAISVDAARVAMNQYAYAIDEKIAQTDGKQVSAENNAQTPETREKSYRKKLGDLAMRAALEAAVAAGVHYDNLRRERENAKVSTED